MSDQLKPRVVKLEHLFFQLWSTAYLLNWAESWIWVTSTIVACAFALGLFFRPSRWLFVSFLIYSTAEIAYDLPIVANHSLFFLIANSFMLIGLVPFHRKKQRVRPWSYLAAGLMAVYFVAGFHKINRDFLNPDVSCASAMLYRWIADFISWKLFAQQAQSYLKPLPIVAIGWELSIPLVACFRQTRVFAYFSAFALHVFLAPIGFVDFSAVSAAILIPSLVASYKGRKHHRKIRIYLKWLIGCVLTAALLSYFWRGGDRTGIYWVQAVLLLVLFIFACAWARTQDQPNFKCAFRGQSLALVLIIFCVGSSNYLGLGTSPTFSMFSNLRTEGRSWNHLILRKTMQIFDYQSDIYFTRYIDRRMEFSSKEHPVRNFGTPRLEIYRLYEIWNNLKTDSDWFVVQKADVRNPKLFVKQLLPPQHNPYNWLESKLLYFRRIQDPREANACRW